MVFIYITSLNCLYNTMSTIAEFISNVNISLNALPVDSKIPNKYVFNMGRNVVADFLKKESESRRITTASEGWSEIDCVEMIEVPVMECGGVDVYLCEKMMRSKYQLPDTFTGYNGNIIKHVASVNFGQIYEPLRGIRIWNDVQKREVKKKNQKYYVFINQHLYIPIPKGEQSAPEQIRIEAYFKNKWEVAGYKSLGCKKCEECISVLNSDFVCPEFLLNAVTKETITIIMNKYKIQQDNRVDNNTQNLTEPLKPST